MLFSPARSLMRVLAKLRSKTAASIVFTIAAVVYCVRTYLYNVI